MSHNTVDLHFFSNTFFYVNFIREKNIFQLKIRLSISCSKASEKRFQSATAISFLEPIIL